MPTPRFQLRLPRVMPWNEARDYLRAELDRSLAFHWMYGPKGKRYDPMPPGYLGGASSREVLENKNDIPVDPTKWIGKKAWYSAESASGLSDRDPALGKPGRWNFVGFDYKGDRLYYSPAYGGTLSRNPNAKHGWQHDNFDLILAGAGALVGGAAIAGAVGGSGAIGGALESAGQTIGGALESAQAGLAGFSLPSLGSVGGVVGGGGALASLDSLLKGGENVATDLSNILSLDSDSNVPDWLRGLGGVVDEGLDIYGRIRGERDDRGDRASSPPPAAPAGGTPGWIMPAVLVGGLVLLVVLLKRGK